jgi:uncharacterized protein DUF5677
LWNLTLPGVHLLGGFLEWASQMPFETDGFFSPEIAKFRHAVRTTHPFRAWFDYALGLNRIGFDLLRHATTRPIDRRLFTIYGHFVRVHHTFQGALLVAERGMASNARILVRGGIESAIALCALSRDETFVDQMIAANRLHQRKIARVVLDNPDYAATYSEGEIAAMRAVVADVDAMEAEGDWKLKEINWANVASEHCPDLYQLLYRSTSSDGTHATIETLNRFVVADENMQITAFTVAPDTGGLVEALSAACLLFIWAADPFASAFDRPDMSDELLKQVRLFAKLPNAFPGQSRP